MTNSTHIIVIGIVALLMSPFWLSKPSAAIDTGPTNTSVTPALNVTLLQPVLQDLPLTLTANGSIAAWHEAIIGAEVGDLHLSAVNVQVGDNVRKGQVLAVFSDETVLTDVAYQRALLAEAEANLAEARINAERAQQITESGALSRQQISQYQTTAKTAQAKVQSAKAQLDAQLLRLKYTKVVAIDDGVISSRSATLGAVVGKGQELFRLIRQNRLEWRAEVSANEMSKLKPGLPVTINVSGVGSIAGKIRSLAPTMDSQNRNGLVYVDVPEATAHGLRAGMYGKGEFNLGTSTTLTVPQTAVALRDGFSYLFAINEPNNGLTTVKQVKVQLGRQVGDRLEILSGISAEDRLVANGATFLSDGDTVRLVQP